MPKILLFSVYVTFSLFGLYKLKLAQPGLNPDYLLGFAAYGSGFVLWLFVLKLYDLSVAFPMAAGSLIVGTQLIGILLLGEDYNAPKVFSVVLILSGLAVLTYADTSFGHG